VPQLCTSRTATDWAQSAFADGRLGRLLTAKAPDDAITDELFLAALARLPRETERVAVRQALTDGDRAEAFRDLFWALANSKEFAFGSSGVNARLGFL